MNQPLTEEQTQQAAELAKAGILLRWSKAKEKLQGFQCYSPEFFQDVRAMMPEHLQLTMTDEMLQAFTVAFNQTPLPSSAEMAQEEMELRKQAAAAYFPEPDEGTNKTPLAAGWQLKLTHKIDRKVDEASMPAIKERLRAMGVNPDPLIKLKSEVATTEYKSLLTLNQAAARVFEEALIIKPASPTLELVPPKEPKA